MDGEIYKLKKNSSKADINNSVALWGCVSISGPRIIRCLTGRQDLVQYLNILEELRSCGESDNRSYAIAHDNHPVHRSRVVKDWFKTQSNLTLLPWPSKSDDLMPMQDVWGAFISFLTCHSNYVTTRVEFQEEIARCWVQASFDEEFQFRIQNAITCLPWALTHLLFN